MTTFGQEIIEGQESIPPSASSLTPEDVREFQQLVREETGVDMTAQEAWDRAIELIALVRMLVRPDSEDRDRCHMAAVQASSVLPTS